MLFFFVQTDSLHNMMEYFWSIEEMSTKILREKEKACKMHFEANTRRLDTGRYEVRLPLSDSADKSGDSYDTAYVKFLKLRQR
jgi:ketosteroid isomerase-like protein